MPVGLKGRMEENRILIVILKVRLPTVCSGFVLLFLVGGRLLEELLATARSLRSWPSLRPREGGVTGMVEKSSLQSSVCVRGWVRERVKWSVSTWYIQPYLQTHLHSD